MCWLYLGAPPSAPHGWVNVGLRASWEDSPAPEGAPWGFMWRRGCAGQPWVPPASTGPAAGLCGGRLCSCRHSRPGSGGGSGRPPCPPATQAGPACPHTTSRGLSCQRRGWHMASAAEPWEALGSMRLAPAWGVGGTSPGYQRASAIPTDEQPDASLPLHVLPLYSLLAPEKQAQVTVWGWGGRLPGVPPACIQTGPGQAPASTPSAVGSAPPGFESIGFSSFPAFSLGALRPEARRGPGHLVTPTPAHTSCRLLSDQEEFPHFDPSRVLS